MPRNRDDELSHQPPADDDGGAWSESWEFELCAADGSLGAWVRFTRRPGAGHAWYEAMLTGPRRQLLAVIDHDVPFRSNPLEIRTTGLWADHICETPVEHWTIGLEAFALGVDDPLELYGRQLGDRVPLGFDLEWEQAGAVVDHDAEPGEPRSYEVPCRVHGEILIGQDEIDFEGVGARLHRWGPGVGLGAEWRVSGITEGDRWWSERSGLDIDVDGHGLPTGGCASDGTLAIEVLAVTPLEIVVAGTSFRRPRALCRLRADDGTVGVGWLERGGDVQLGEG